MRVAGQGRRQVDLEQPGFQVRVNHDVVAKKFKAVSAVDASLLSSLKDVSLAGNKGLEDYVEDA